MDFDATLVPADIVAALSLTQDVRYTCQNLSGTATLFVREAGSVPSITDRAFRVESSGEFTLRPSGDPIFLWTDDPSGCPLILGVAV